MRKLGTTQQRVLECLREHGGWSERCGWVWSGPRDTLRIMRTLVARGVAVETERNGRPYFEAKDKS